MESGHIGRQRWWHSGKRWKEEKKTVGVYDLLGMAMGCIGMPFSEFCNYYFDEFECICNAWNEMNEAHSREAWERTRILATISIQPHVKKRLTPQQLIPLPWDKKKPSAEEAQELTSAERLKRFESTVDKIALR